MSSYNRVVLMGHVGGAPDVRVTTAGRPLVKFGLATNRAWKGPDDAWREETDWHKIVVFNPLADRLQGRIARGDLVFVEGRLRRRTWKGDDGSPRSTTEVVADRVRVLGRLMPRNGASEPVDGPASVDADIPF